MRVFQYWEGEKPAYIKLCHQVIARTNSQHVTILGKNDVTMPWDMSDYELPRQVDLIRLKTLYENGGVWVDSDCYCHHDLSPIFDLLDKYDFVGMTECPENIGEHITPNGFFACRPKSAVIGQAWQEAKKIMDEKLPSYGWSGFGADLLTKAVHDHPDACFHYPFRCVCPISLWEVNKFFVRDSDRKHFSRFWSYEDAIMFMLYNSMVPDFSKYDEKELMESDMFISYLFRRILRD